MFKLNIGKQIFSQHLKQNLLFNLRRSGRQIYIPAGARKKPAVEGPNFELNNILGKWKIFKFVYFQLVQFSSIFIALRLHCWIENNPNKSPPGTIFSWYWEMYTLYIICTFCTILFTHSMKPLNNDKLRTQAMHGLLWKMWQILLIWQSGEDKT